MAHLPLHQAVKKGRTEEITKLIEAGAHLDELDDFGLTPLYWAAYHDHAEAVCILVKAGADPRVRDENGRTPLHWISFKRGCNHKAYKFLVGAGADPNAPDRFGWAARSRPKFNPHDSSWGGSIRSGSPN